MCIDIVKHPNVKAWKLNKGILLTNPLMFIVNYIDVTFIKPGYMKTDVD